MLHFLPPGGARGAKRVVISKQPKEYISEAYPHSIAFKPTLRWNAQKFGSRLHRSGLPYECPRATIELYGEARPKPQTLRRRAPKNIKNSSLCWGKAFWTESGSLISVSKSIPPHLPPCWGYIPKIRFDIFFGPFLAFRNWQNALNYGIFAF